jgi:hypothetical protein
MSQDTKTSIHSLPVEIIAEILSRTKYDSQLFLVNKLFYNACHLSMHLYGANISNVRWTILIETSDHDGWCSGNECEYSCCEEWVDIPLERKCHGHGELFPELQKMRKHLLEFCEDPECPNPYPDHLSHLPPPINTYGSYYCDNSRESEENDLSTHEYRLSLLEADIV